MLLPILPLLYVDARAESERAVPLAMESGYQPDLNTKSEQSISLELPRVKILRGSEEVWPRNTTALISVCMPESMRIPLSRLMLSPGSRQPTAALWATSA